MARLPRLSSLLLALSLSLAASCAAQEAQPFGDSAGKADSPFSVSDLVNGTAPAIGVLRLVNDPATSEDLLDDDARLTSSAARNIIEHRSGQGNSNLFDDIEELDAVAQVGPSALQHLLDYAFDNGFVPQGDDELGTYEGVSFSVNQASAVLHLVNLASAPQLDDDIGLDSRSVTAILETRPVLSILSLADLPFVGSSALEKLKSQAGSGTQVREIGVVSDLDKTIVPPAPAGQALPDQAYPGIAELITFLEFGDGSGAAGDVNFVTARQPSMVTEIPTWLEAHGVPLGPIGTGISGIPFIAKDEKVRDITEVFEANPDQKFVLFGDTSHVDPDVYREILATFPDQVQVAFVHNVKTIDATRLEGLVLVDNYAQSAAELFRQGLLSEDEARMVMTMVISGGEITDAEMEALIADNQPN
jgi:hypothetical protein